MTPDIGLWGCWKRHEAILNVWGIPLDKQISQKLCGQATTFHKLFFTLKKYCWPNGPYMHQRYRSSFVYIVACHLCGSWTSCSRVRGVNSLWPSYTIELHRIESPFVPVMACCLMAPNHYLNQCWFIISNVLCESFEGGSPQISKTRIEICILEQHSDLLGAIESMTDSQVIHIHFNCLFASYGQ